MTLKIKTLPHSLRKAASFGKKGFQALTPLAFCALFAACSNTKTVDTSPKPDQTGDTDIELIVSDDHIGPVVIEDRPFTMDSLYALMVAELAISRKRYDIALGNYVQQALSTQDIGVAARATHIARGLNARQSALEMSQLWLDLEPHNKDAQLIASYELIEANHLLEAFELSAAMLKKGESPAFDSIAAKAEKGDISIVNELIDRYSSLIPEYKGESSLWLGYSILLMQAGQLEAALDAAKKAKSLDKGSIKTAFQETRVLHKMGKTAEANESLATLVKENPENIGLRARYARLIWPSSPDEAREQFKILHQQSPGDGEILYSLALVEKDLGHLDAAKARFQLLISRNQYPSEAYFHLGEIAQKQHDDALALSHYEKVGAGQSYVRAIMNATDILVAQNKRNEAVEKLKTEQKTADGAALQSLYLLEADLYQNENQFDKAEAALTAGIKKFPNSTQLIYSRAMVYAQQNLVTPAERDFKRVLELVPENAAALNALGYTLADQTDRYQEAYEYIKQAYALTPEDPAVIDSMGWVAYRLGNYEEALEKLRKAMKAFPDHEIAAHLGEVLWVTGNHEEAQRVWKQGLELNPASAIIEQTLRRLEAKID